MKIVIFFLLIAKLSSLTLYAQTAPKDPALMRKIDTMFKYDQFWRREYSKLAMKKPSKYTEDEINDNWAKTDSLNEIKAKAIINNYGYPGYDLVAEASNDFWAIVQHCDDDIVFQERVLLLLKVQVDKNNADKTNYALLTDRVLVNKHQKQIYGTQVRVDPATHATTPLPLKYPEKVDELRKKMGLPPLKDYLKSFE